MSCPRPITSAWKCAGARIEPGQILRQQLTPSGKRHPARARERVPVELDTMRSAPRAVPETLQPPAELRGQLRRRARRDEVRDARRIEIDVVQLEPRQRGFQSCSTITPRRITSVPAGRSFRVRFSRSSCPAARPKRSPRRARSGSDPAARSRGWAHRARPAARTVCRSAAAARCPPPIRPPAARASTRRSSLERNSNRSKVELRPIPAECRPDAREGDVIARPRGTPIP